MRQKVKSFVTRLLQRSLAKQLNDVIALWIGSYTIRYADGGLLGLWSSFNLHKVGPFFLQMIWLAMQEFVFILLSLVVVCYYLSLVLFLMSICYKGILWVKERLKDN